MKCLEHVWREKQLFDFTVKINEETIQCHRLMLGSCSEFFQGLFRSGMREVTDNCVVIQDVSSEVFHLIIKALYTGVNILTSENFIDIWHAVHQLQITFMVDLCENYAIKSISKDTWGKIYVNSKYLCSELVLDKLQTFMLNNFDQISHSSTFLQLSFTEVEDLINSQELVVHNEDNVLEYVIRWVEYITEINLIYDDDTSTNNGVVSSAINEIPDECAEISADDYVKLKRLACDKINLYIVTSEERLHRQAKLTKLLKLVRTCLVSPSVLKKVHENPLIQENNDAKNIIFHAMSYHVLDFRHGQWPSAAIHRLCSNYSNYGAYAQSDGRVCLLDPLKDNVCPILPCSFLRAKILLAFDNELYAVGKHVSHLDREIRMVVYRASTWENVINMPSWALLLVAHRQFIYIINRNDNVIYSLQPKLKIPKLTKFYSCPEKEIVDHAVIYKDYMLLFCSVTKQSIEETAVYMLDIVSKTGTILENIDGTSENLISFRNDKNCYILQSNGSLWVIMHSSCSKKVNFKFLVKLWNFQKKIYGALTYNGTLIIFGNDPTCDPADKKKLDKVPYHFETVKYLGKDATCSNFIPVILERERVHRPASTSLQRD